jgi:hypothetical protein
LAFAKPEVGAAASPASSTLIRGWMEEGRPAPVPVSNEKKWNIWKTKLGGFAQRFESNDS